MVKITISFHIFMNGQMELGGKNIYHWIGIGNKGVGYG